MAFIVAPTTNFNSYIETTFADAYHADRGNTAWDEALTDAKRIACIKASDFINLHYTPTSDFIVDDVVEPAVKTATAMLALVCLTEDLFAIRAERDIIEEESSLDGVASEKLKYSTARNDRFPMVTSMLAGLATPKSASAIVSTQVR